MSTQMVPLKALFDIKSGDFHATRDLDSGSVPLISCGDFDNGFIGYYDVPETKRYKNKITVAYNGQPLTVKYHPYEFAAKDDIGVLIPKEEMSESLQLLVAARLNMAKWRYSYGRKCFKQKLEDFEIELPDQELADTLRLSGNTKVDKWETFVPEKRSKATQLPDIQWRQVLLSDLFGLQRGDFHSITDLSPGEYPTVSRLTSNNGIAGNYEKPANARVYPAGSITVSTVGADAFVQLVDFIATDNVIVCVPKIELSNESICFIASMINQQKWRYSYGRQPYKAKLERVKIYLPFNGQTINEAAIQAVFSRSPYWYLVDKKLNVS